MSICVCKVFGEIIDIQLIFLVLENTSGDFLSI